MKRRQLDPEKSASSAEADLCRALLSLRTPAQMLAFLRDLCTPAELEAMTDRWQVVPYLLQGLAKSADERVAAIAGKGIKEVAYHVRRSSDLVVRLGDGTDESHARMQSAVDELWRYTGELFTDDEIDRDVAARGLGCELGSLREPWLTHVRNVLQEATLTAPDEAQAYHALLRGGRQGRHTEDLGYVLAEMQHLQRAYPGAVW